VGGRVDKLAKRKKLKARKMPKKRAAYPPSAAPTHDGVMFHQRNCGAMGVYCKRQTNKPYKAMEMGLCALPSCTVVTDPYDVSIGGAISDPFRKL
jgi:hypothetical protein